MKASSALKTLHRLTREVGQAPEFGHALQTLVTGLARAMETQACSIYLPDPQREGGWVLRAVDGLNPDSVGAIRLAPGEGLISQVAREEEPLNLGSIWQYPHYRYFPELCEERLVAFLGVPIFHRGQVQGVLCIQSAYPQAFNEEHETLLFTAAAQLGGTIAHSQILERLKVPPQDPSQSVSVPIPREREEKLLEGQPSAQGISIGTAWALNPPAELRMVEDLPTADPEADKDLFRQAFQAIEEEFKELGGPPSEQLQGEDQELFHAYLHILQDRNLQERVERLIDGGAWVQTAIRNAVQEYAEALDVLADPYLRERAADVRHLGQRLLGYLRQSHEGNEEVPTGTILIGEEISPLLMASFPPTNIRGIISATGSAGSHTAVLARAYGIPAVLGVEGLPISLITNKQVVVDGYQGRVYIDPSETILNEYRRLEQEEAAFTQQLAKLHDEPTATSDGHTLTLQANTGLLADIEPALRSGAEGIGLYRTEFPFLTRDRFPSVMEQVRIFRQVLEAFSPYPVTIRTLDIGGDKLLPYLPIQEDNPFLGWRGLRLTQDHPEIFLAQVRAILRAAEYGQARILLPMVSTLEELDRALELIRQARQELAQHHGKPAAELPIGAMIEVPSAVFQAGAIARRVDFLSIGTNDLTQYLLAVDRNNARVAHLFNSLHPSVIQAVRITVTAAHEEGRLVSVCGEMAADPLGALLLVGMGVDELSMSAAALPRIKWVLRSFTLSQIQEFAELVQQDEYTQTTLSRMRGILDEAGLGRLIRSGS